MDRIISSQRSILVVADDPVIVGTVGLVFRAFGYQISVASGTDETLALVAADPPSVVLCDAELPGVDVAQLTRQIRTIRGGERIVVIITGHGPEPAANAADGFVLRPFDPMKVLDLLEPLGSR